MKSSVFDLKMLEQFSWENLVDSIYQKSNIAFLRYEKYRKKKNGISWFIEFDPIGRNESAKTSLVSGVALWLVFQFADYSSELALHVIIILQDDTERLLEREVANLSNVLWNRGSELILFWGVLHRV